MVTTRQIKEINLDVGICFLCSKTFEGKSPKNPLSKTMNHALPKMLKPKKNILFPLHLECHKKLNSIYKLQEKRTPIPMELNRAKQKLSSAIKSKDDLDEKLMEVYAEIENLYPEIRKRKKRTTEKKIK